MNKNTRQRGVDENHYEGLMSSMRQARNRLLFFVLFAVYSFLAILGTTDKMLFLESAVKMPLLNIELPLLAFYAVMPLFLLVLYFHLLYTFRLHREFLLATYRNNSQIIAILPFGIFEGALFGRRNFHGIMYSGIWLIFYFLPLMVFVAFWFADYQSPVMSWWHLVILLVAMGLMFHFQEVLTKILLNGLKIKKTSTLVN